MSESDCKISIVMPVYNVEKYINISINSILSQTYKNFELLLIDDGSKDNCPKICDEFAQNDNRIRVIHKENGGLSDARNCGIKNATGDYIMFFDSDDYLSSEMALEYIVDKIEKEKRDVVMFFFKYSFENRDVNGIVEYNSNYKNIKLNGKTKSEQLEELVKNNVYISSAVVKVVRRQLFIDNDLYFVKGIYSEDVDWSARLMIYAKSFSLLNESLYVYRQRDLSISQTVKKKTIVDISNNVIKCINLADKVSEDYKESYMNYVSYQYITFLNVYLLCKDDVKYKLKEMKSYSDILKYHWNSKVNQIYTFKKFLGFNLMMKALKFYLKVRKNSYGS